MTFCSVQYSQKHTGQDRGNSSTVKRAKRLISGLYKIEKL